MDESIKEDVRASTIAALTAYAEATGERVVYNNTDRFPMTFSHVGVRSFTVEPGEQIVARKVGT